MSLSHLDGSHAPTVFYAPEEKPQVLPHSHTHTHRGSWKIVAWNSNECTIEQAEAFGHF